MIITILAVALEQSNQLVTSSIAQRTQRCSAHPKDVRLEQLVSLVCLRKNAAEQKTQVLSTCIGQLASIHHVLYHDFTAQSKKGKDLANAVAALLHVEPSSSDHDELWGMVATNLPHYSDRSLPNVDSRCIHLENDLSQQVDSNHHSYISSPVIMITRR